MESIEDTLFNLRVELEFYFLKKIPFKLFISQALFEALKEKFPEAEERVIFGVPFDITNNLLLGEFFIIPLKRASFFEN